MRRPGTVSPEGPLLEVRSPHQKVELWGLYERLLKERAEEEQRHVEPLPHMRGLASNVFVRRLEDSKGRPGYAADLSMMHRLITRGSRNAGESMRLGSLKAKYRMEYAELRAERQGQQELL